MKIAEHIRSLDPEGRLLADAAQEAGTGAPVPTCPGWHVNDLLGHTAMVHTWAAAFVTEGHTSYGPRRRASGPGRPGTARPVPCGAPTPGGGAGARAAGPGVLDLLRRAVAPGLLGEAAGARDDDPPGGRRVRTRRAPLSGGVRTSRWTASTSCCAVSTPARRAGCAPTFRARWRVRATDTGSAWTVRLSTEPPATVREEDGSSVLPSADCELSANAHELYLALWNRLPLAALTVAGDPELARLWRDNSSVV